MRIPTIDTLLLPLSLVAAFVLWYVIFDLSPFNFWTELASATLLLGGIAIYRMGSSLRLNQVWTLRAWIIGTVSALILYLVFWIGGILSQWTLPTSSGEISTIYAYRGDMPPWVILLVLLFPIGPCEEIFWRGFVQSSLSKKYGKNRGLLAASLLYGLVHVWAGNLMLLLAALTCGFFWGWLYQREEELVPVIISHALWDVLIFVVIPVQ